MRRLEFAEIARADLRSIRRYSQRAWGVERTAQYMTALRHTMKGLVAGTVVSRERDDLRLGLHMAISGRHCIFFEADLWRETFLSKGDARLFVLDLKGLSVKSAGNARPLAATELLQSNNRRLVLEQLLVMEAVSRVDDSIWIVNARHSAVGLWPWGGRAGGSEQGDSVNLDTPLFPIVRRPSGIAHGSTLRQAQGSP